MPANAEARTAHDRSGRTLRDLLSAPVDGSSLALFRIVFGLVMAWHLAGHLPALGAGPALQRITLDPGFHFTYPGFSWVRPWPQPWMSLHIAVVAIAGLMVAAGWLYRVSTFVVAAGFTYVFLIDRAAYNNHYYLMSLLAFLLFLMPADRVWSVDSWIRRRRSGGGVASNDGTIPFWPVFLLRAQLFVVYFYGGIAKFNGDWLTGVPLYAPAEAIQSFLENIGGIGDHLTPIQIGLFLAWAGLIYDLLVGFLVLSRRTRLWALAATAVFHGVNHFVFPIGVFPTLAFASTLIFFDPDWPRQLASWIRRRPATASAPDLPAPGAPFRISWACFVFVLGFATTQALLPWRHLLIAGDANWTEEGQDFAWRMMLRAKAAGFVAFHVDDPGLLTTDDRGVPQVRWAEWKDDDGRNAVYVAMDAPRFDWRDHPGVTVLFEPAVGYRAVQALPPGEIVSVARARLADQWERWMGRRVEVLESIPLSEAVDRIRDAVTESPEVAAAAKSAVRQLLDPAIVGPVLEGRGDSAGGSEPQLAKLAGRIAGLLAADETADLVRPLAMSIAPLELQGARAAGRKFLILHDPALQSESGRLRLTSLTSGRPYLVWIDFERTRAESWSALPPVFAAFEQRALRIHWNAQRELNLPQMERLGISPWMLRQYAGHIAAIWREKHGRAPGVSARSQVMLNYRTPQPLVDPNVDLASAPYSFLRHNDWILPLNDGSPKTADRETPNTLHR